MTFAEWEALRKGQTPATNSSTPADAPAETSVLPAESTRYEPGLGDASEGFGYKAAAKELARTAGETAVGLARSPVDILKGVLGLPGQVLEGGRQLVNLAADPSLLKESGRAAKMGIDYLGEHPREGGSLIGQLLLAPKVPEAAKFVAQKAPAVVGNTMSAVGRGAEAVGDSRPVRALSKYGPLEGILSKDWKGFAAAVAPPILRYGGQALQAVGERVANTDVLGGLARAVQRFSPGEQLRDPTAADSLRTTVETARDMASKGASRKQANARAGYDIKSQEVSYDRTSQIDQPDLSDFTGPRETAEILRDRSQTREALGANPVANRRDVMEGLKSATQRGRRSTDSVSERRMQELLTRFGGNGK